MIVSATLERTHSSQYGYDMAAAVKVSERMLAQRVAFVCRCSDVEGGLSSEVVE